MIFHTDQGSEGVHRWELPRRLHGVRITQSMGRTGSAPDNAAIESEHSTVGFELRSLEHFTTKPQGTSSGPGLDRGVQP